MTQQTQRLIRGLLLVCALSISACTVSKQFVATGGDKSAGTVELSFEYGAFEKPVYDPEQAQSVAESRCAVWGYSGAVPFGSYRTQCVYASGGGCSRYMYSVEYQCTD